MPASFQTWLRWPKETLPCERDPQKQKQPRWPWWPWWSKKLRCETHAHVMSCQQCSISTGTSNNIKHITTIQRMFFLVLRPQVAPQFSLEAPSHRETVAVLRCEAWLQAAGTSWGEHLRCLGTSWRATWQQKWGLKKVRDLSWYNISWSFFVFFELSWSILIYFDWSWEMMVSYSQNMGAWTLFDGPSPRSFGRREPAPEPLFRRASRWRFGILFSPHPFAGEFSLVCALENLHMVSYI